MEINLLDVKIKIRLDRIQMKLSITVINVALIFARSVMNYLKMSMIINSLRLPMEKSKKLMRQITEEAGYVIVETSLDARWMVKLSRIHMLLFIMMIKTTFIYARHA